MGMACTGIVRAEGVPVTSLLGTDLVLLQRIDTTTNQYTPRVITVENFLYNGLSIREGTNATMGVATLASGTVTVSTTAVAANSRIYLSRQAANSSTGIGSLTVGTVTAATSFVINSLGSTGSVVAGDTSIVAWLIVQPTT